MASWFEQLDDARDVSDVVSIVRDYFATWTPQEIARLPVQSRPQRIRAAEDVEDLHASAVEAYRATRASGDDLTALQLMTGLLARASVRLAQLRGAGEAQPEVSSTSPPRRQGTGRDR
jgi:predicted Zn-dependent peptidase